MHKIVTETVAIVEKIVKNGKVEHMEQEKHGTAEHVEQENGRRKKISVNFMKNRMHIAQKHKIKIVKILKMTKKNIDDLLTLGELRTMIQVWNRFHKAKCQNGNDANVERKAVGKAFREIRREL